MWHNAREQQNAARSQRAEAAELEKAQLTDQLEAEQRKTEEYLDMLRRSQADFVNFRRRVGQEQAEAGVTAQVALLQRLLPALDDLGRALTSTPAEMSGEPWVQGLHLVARRLGLTFEELGIRQIGREGERFDPRWHEAVAMSAQANVAEGTIVHVVKPGYILGERIVQTAQVVVAGEPAPAEA